MCQTPPQSAASCISLASEINPFLSASNSSTHIQHQSTVPSASASSSSSTVATSTFKTKDDLNAFRSRVRNDHDLLKQNLKDSYQRLRLLQTKTFGCHVQQNLNKLNEAPKTADPIDEASINLLNAVLTSSEEAAVTTTVATTGITTMNSSCVAATLPPSADSLKNLLDDIHYELLKQNEDKAVKRTQYLKELRLNHTNHTTAVAAKLAKKPRVRDYDSDKTDSDYSSDEEALAESMIGLGIFYYLRVTLVYTFFFKTDVKS